MKSLIAFLSLFFIVYCNAQQPSNDSALLEGLFMKKVSALDSVQMKVPVFKHIRSDLTFTNLSLNQINLVGTLQGTVEITGNGELTETILQQGQSMGSNMVGQTVKIPYTFANQNNLLYLTFISKDQNGTPFEYQEIYERLHIK